MDITKKGLRAVLACFALVGCLGLFNQVSLGLHFPGLLLNSLAFDSVYVAWGYSVFRRFPQKQMRFYMSFLVATFVLLNLLRTAKYGFVLWDSPFQRYLWYGYYVPIVLGPLLMFRAALNIGKPNGYHASRRWNWLYLPAVLLAVGVLTNDFHQTAFRFAPDFANWQGNYARGPLYIAVVGWSALLAGSVLLLAVRSAVSRHLFKTAWLLLLVLAVTGLFGLGYVFDLSFISLLDSIISLPEYICLSTIAFWESLVAARIVASNKGYPAAFAASSLHVGLSDLQYQVQQTSAEGIRPTQQQLRQASNGELLLPDGDTLLKVRPVQGGWFYWTEDVAELRRLNEALDNAAEELAEENNTLRAIAEMEESRRQTAAQIQLYDSVIESLHPQLETMSKWLTTLPAQEDAFCAVLTRVSVLLAYCKRRSSLLLQAQAHPVLTGEDMQLCLTESAKALSMGGVLCEIAVASHWQASVQDAVLLYEAFESVLEAMLSVLKGLTVELAIEANGGSVFCLTAELLQEPPQQVRRAFEAAAHDLEKIAVRFVFSETHLQKGGAQDAID